MVVPLVLPVVESWFDLNESWFHSGFILRFCRRSRVLLLGENHGGFACDSLDDESNGEEAGGGETPEDFRLKHPTPESSTPPPDFGGGV